MTINEYKTSGAYHAELKLPRQWLPRYFRRLHVAEEILFKHMPRDACIADIGGGEGVLVRRLVERGFSQVFGLDRYAPFLGSGMIRGSILRLPFGRAMFDAVTCLDVLEHIPLHLQSQACGELARVLKPQGVALVSVPNMAHFKSRMRLLVMGEPWRNSLEKHPGELSAGERIKVLHEAGLTLVDSVGLHLTLSYDPRPRGCLGRLLSRIMFSPNVPSGLCWTVLFLLHKGPRPLWVEAGHRPLKKALASYRPMPEDPTGQ